MCRISVGTTLVVGPKVDIPECVVHFLKIGFPNWGKLMPLGPGPGPGLGPGAGPALGPGPGPGPGGGPWGALGSPWGALGGPGPGPWPWPWALSWLYLGPILALSWPYLGQGMGSKKHGKLQKHTYPRNCQPLV